MATNKQIVANKENAKKGGVKSDEGKSIVRWNALKHGLLARETVIDSGDGQEDRSEFDSLLVELRSRLAPEGVLEEMLVEKIAVAYWRYRRAVRHEVGLLRSQLDRYQEDYFNPEKRFGEKTWKNHRQIQSEIDGIKDYVGYFQDPDDKQGDYINPQKIEEEDWAIDLKEYYMTLLDDSEIPWQESFTNPEYEYDLQAIYLWLVGNGWTPKKIKTEFVRIAQTKIKEKNVELEAALALDNLRLSRMAKERVLPGGNDADNLIRYETAILRQFYRAMHELERLQSSRSGVAVPPPVTVDVDVAPPNP
jgi:hypothetical protein